ncbi:MAG: pyrimidine 5'-nucleotidase [Rhodobacterales bacterium]|nr:MAG: pyrimidine 5'-nucleotidase [Rhodobacterales bacterium]PIE09204.1 MAG: pyrimidine 5'-nucleotidase [Rhodobacterales bacterium]
MQDFKHVTGWVFDLDNTLYPPSTRLFDQIEPRMTDWVMQEAGVSRAQADALRKQYWAQYGTTLAGLIAEHGTDPAPYLTHVHDIDFSVLAPSPELARAITQLPGRRIVYTNGSVPYAEKVLSARGLSGAFDAVYGIENADFQPKPDPGAYRKILSQDGMDPEKAAMFEDDPRNLKAPAEMGMRTVHVSPTPGPDAAHIHHHTADLTAFLQTLIATLP